MTFLGVILIIGAFSAIPHLWSKSAEAFCSPSFCWCESCINDKQCDSCQEATEQAIGSVSDPTDTGGLGNHFSTLLLQYTSWLIDLWNIIFPLLPPLTEHLTAASILPTGFIGGFFDAKHQLDTQLAFDEFYVKAIYDYQPSTALCKFGTMRRGLAVTQQLARVNHVAMIDQSMAYHLNRGGSTREKVTTIQNRILQFRNNFCNPSDSAGNFQSFCAASVGAEQYNQDIDITSTLVAPRTLDVSMVDETLTAQENALFTLARNLYAGRTFVRPSRGSLSGGGSRPTTQQKLYHKYRSLIAKKNVAENSYYAIAADKAKGTGFTADYMKSYATHFGLNPADFSTFYSDEPSYDAQMEILTKRMLQGPDFIIGLMDRPENIDRQHAALLSIELMQERDMYLSMRRQEALLAVMMEKQLQARMADMQTKLAD